VCGPEQEADSENSSVQQTFMHNSNTFTEGTRNDSYRKTFLEHLTVLVRAVFITPTFCKNNALIKLVLF